MSRKNQSHNFFHVMVRGNNKQNIFFNSQDYDKCSNILSDITQLFHCKIHLFCFMTNHMHFLIETSDVPLARIMQTFLSTYAKYINKTYDRVGHLFQGRYKAKPVITHIYFLELIYYIHNNPVKANLVKNISDYFWSSYHYYKFNKQLSWLTTDYVKKFLLNLGLSYSNFIENFHLQKQSPEFCVFDSENYLDIKKERILLSNNDDRLKFLGLISFEQICKTVCHVTKFDYRKLDSVSHSKQACLARSIICYYAHFHANIPIKHIAAQFERNSQSLSKTMYKYIKDQSCQKIMKQIELDLLKAISAKQINLNLVDC